MFLGSGVVPDACFGASDTDEDGDGLGEFCAEQLAYAFRPEVNYWSADNVQREPRWVAAPTDGSESPVRLGYLFSYYRDEGSSNWRCDQAPSFFACSGHNGDAEAVFLDVYHNFATQHWVLHEAAYSAHSDWITVSRSGGQYPDVFWVWEYNRPWKMKVEYPDRPGGYPRVFVSEGKHANYFTRQQGDFGGMFNVDTCEQVNTVMRSQGGGWVTNLGSRSSPLLNCVVTENVNHDYYGSGRLECYWTGAEFRGWYPEGVGGAESGPYSAVLASMGF